MQAMAGLTLSRFQQLEHAADERSPSSIFDLNEGQ
jgi:hypothetical protein